MLDEYKELYRNCADLIPGWSDMSKNDLCRAYVAAKGDLHLQNSYLSAIMYKYWHLISKYYYMSVGCATAEDCHEWLADSVLCCLNMASWENEKSSIYRDPDGPDKVINRCMKCARLTHYQFSNRKKRKNNFGLQSLDELAELLGKGAADPPDRSQEFDISSIMIDSYIQSSFAKKDYFMAIMVDCIIRYNVFDVTVKAHDYVSSEFNLRKLVKIMSNLDEDYIFCFAQKYDIPYETVKQGVGYVQRTPPGGMRKKLQLQLEAMKHTDLVKDLQKGHCYNVD